MERLHPMMKYGNLIEVYNNLIYITSVHFEILTKYVVIKLILCIGTIIYLKKHTFGEFLEILR